MDNISLQKYREDIMATLPSVALVYVLCDFFHAPLYAGASISGRARARRHITSARSDLISNRSITVHEIAYIDIYIPRVSTDLNALERERIFTLNSHRPLFNTKIPKEKPEVEVPEPISFQLIPEDELNRFRYPTSMILHQSKALADLAEYIQTTKDNAATRRVYKIRHNLHDYHMNNWVNNAA